MIRKAAAGDVGALVRLRSEMFAAMAITDPDPEWRSSAARWFAAHLDDPDVHIMVADLPGEGPVSAATATISRSAPSPGNARGVTATVSHVVTSPAHRGRGYAGACLDAVLAALDAVPDVAMVTLLATDSGRSLYDVRGFVTHPYPQMRRPGRQR